MAEGVEDFLIVWSAGVQAEAFGIFGLFGLDVCWEVLVSEASFASDGVLAVPVFQFSVFFVFVRRFFLCDGLVLDYDGLGGVDGTVFGGWSAVEA